MFFIFENFLRGFILRVIPIILCYWICKNGLKKLLKVISFIIFLVFLFSIFKYRTDYNKYTIQDISPHTSTKKNVIIQIDNIKYIQKKNGSKSAMISFPIKSTINSFNFYREIPLDEFDIKINLPIEYIESDVYILELSIRKRNELLPIYDRLIFFRYSFCGEKNFNKDDIELLSKKYIQLLNSSYMLKQDMLNKCFKNEKFYHYEEIVFS